MVAPPTDHTTVDQDALLLAYLTGGSSLPQLALDFRVTIDDLLQWLASPGVRDRLQRIAQEEERRAYFASRSARASAAAALHDIVKDKASRPANVCRAAIALLRHSPPHPDAQPQQRPQAHGQQHQYEPAPEWTHEQAMAVLEALGRVADAKRERELKAIDAEMRERVRMNPDAYPANFMYRDPPQPAPASQFSSG